MRPCLVIAIAFIALPFSYSILEADSIDWNRHGYLAKVIGRDQYNNFTLCTGAIITGSLILTSAECVTEQGDENKNLTEFAVVLQINIHKRRHLAFLVEKTETWAVLRIDEIKTEKLCPPSPEVKKVLRLSVKPTLHDKSLLEVSEEAILNSKCYLLGFKTSEDPIEFFKTKEAFRLDLDKVNKPRQGDTLYRSKIQGNATACYEDVGAPLICNTQDQGTMLVGMFQNLGTEIGTENDVKVKTNPTDLTPTVCANAYEMNFSLFQSDSRLSKLIEREDLGSFVDIYKKCRFI